MILTYHKITKSSAENGRVFNAFRLCSQVSEELYDAAGVEETLEVRSFGKVSIPWNHQGAPKPLEIVLQKPVVGIDYDVCSGNLR